MESVARIVVFRSDFSDQEKQFALLRQHGAKITRVLKIINGIAVEVSPDKERTLSGASEVLRIDIDEPVVEAL